MTIFDQRGQNVGQQQNAGRDINLYHAQFSVRQAQNQDQLADELEKLKSEVSKAARAEVIDSETFTDADYQITKAIQQTRKPNPDKKSIIAHLNKAKSFFEGVTAVGAIIKAIDQLSQLTASLL